MSNPSFSVVILTAAPSGLGAESGGAFVKIDGREVLLRTVELFLNREGVKQVQVVFNEDFLEEGKRKYGGHFGFAGVKVTGGGARWIEQLAASADKLGDGATHVLVHDAARPAISYLDLDAITDAAAKHPIAALATPVRAPLMEVDETGAAVACHLPHRFMYFATPIVYTIDKFKEVVARKHEPHASEITLIKGSPLNVRCGGPGDATLVKAMLNMVPKQKVKPLTSPFEEAQW